MFTGKTAVDMAAMAADEDLKAEEATRAPAAPIEELVDKWRDRVFEVQEWSSRLFPRDPESREKVQFRITRKNGYCYIERVYAGGDGKSASGYAGLMVHEEDFPGFVKVAVEAYRKMNGK
jgi:hypothetical protein